MIRIDRQLCQRMCFRIIVLVGRPKRDVRLDEILLLQEQDLALDVRRDDRHVRDAHDQHDVVDVGLERRDHEQDEHEAREGIDEVREIGDTCVELSTSVAGQHAEHRAEEERDEDCQQPRQKVGLDAHDQSRQHVPAHEVSAKQMPRGPRRRHHELEVDVLRIARQQIEGAEEIGNHDQCHDQQAVADVNQVDGVRLFPERQVRELADLTGYLGIGFHKVILSKLSGSPPRRPRSGTGCPCARRLRRGWRCP